MKYHTNHFVLPYFVASIEFTDAITQQESILVGCKLPACQPYAFHNEPILTVRRGGGAYTVRSKLNKFEHN